MAYEVPGFIDNTHVAGADLSALQFTFVKLNSSKQVVGCNGVTDRPFGILQDKPLSGKGAVVMCNGISKLYMAAGNTPGDQIGTDGAGLGAVYVPGTDTTKYIVGTVVDDSDAASGLGSVAFNCLNASRGA